MLAGMSTPVRHSIEPLPGFRSREVALFLAQMDDQSRRLAVDTRGLEAEGLGWQPAPGMNSIGMLLAHIAVVEVFWTRLVLENQPMPFESHDVLGIGLDDDGLPLKPDARPPAGLAGRELGFFDDLLGRARAHTKRVAATVDDQDLEREIAREHPNPETGEARSGRVVTLRWTLYHVLEHEAGHYGQVLLLRHLLRAAGRERAGA
jgi:uncharacterized damage-inducible protein DinB